ncbi:MAG: phosphate ABC transporter substrate-binding protein [Proteobacteria bacterium]|nr:phosphate ABC transporter substrate-binding protein [Pseudomonadota bacterium]
MSSKFFRGKNFIILSFILALLQIIQQAQAFDFNIFKSHRSYLYLVGSSTVSPFMSSVSEEFNRVESKKNPNALKPVVESDGSTGGFQLFCQGVGYKYPDFINASRLIKENEIENCRHNGVKEIVEIKIGYDGIVLANSIGSKKIKLTKEQIFLALAEKIYDVKSGKIINNPYQNWNEIDAKLPKKKIIVYGPPLTSGTRDVFADIVLEEVCFMKKEFISAFPERDERRRQCRKIRTDGNFIESGENDNLIVQNLKDHPDALGIFGFNFLVVNTKSIQAVAVDNVEPSFVTIASKKYELSRPLFVYFKKEHLNLLPEMRDFIKEIISSETIGKKGYLLHNGLIALSDEELQQVRKNILAEIKEEK